MKSFIALTLMVLITNCHTVRADVSRNGVSDPTYNYYCDKGCLYNYIIYGMFDDAIGVTRNLLSKSQETEVRGCIQMLLDYNKKIAIDYAYKLWIAGDQTTVAELFPPSYKLLFAEKEVYIVTSKNYASIRVESDNYSGTGHIVAAHQGLPAFSESWVIHPAWDAVDNHVYFKIISSTQSLYLSLDGEFNSNTDVKVIAQQNYNKEDALWSVEPLSGEDKDKFIFKNKQRGVVLNVNADGDLRGNSGYIGNNEYSWKIDATSIIPPFVDFKNRFGINAEADLILDELTTSITKSVLVGDYATAINFTKKLYESNLKKFMQLTVKLLLLNMKNNVMTYASRLWNNGNSNIVKEHFPEAFALILEQKNVTIATPDNYLYLKHAYNTHAWVDTAVTYGSIWKFCPKISNSHSIIFVIKNVASKNWLKVNNDSEYYYNDVGGNPTYMKWDAFNLEAIDYNGEVLFYIVNKQHDRILTLQGKPNTNNNWSAALVAIPIPEQYNSYPMTFGWKIAKAN